MVQGSGFKSLSAAADLRFNIQSAAADNIKLKNAFDINY